MTTFASKVKKIDRYVMAKRVTSHGDEYVVIGYRPDPRDPFVRAARAFRRAGPRRVGYTRQKPDEDRAWWFYSMGDALDAADSLAAVEEVVARADREFPPQPWHASEKRARRALDRLTSAMRDRK